MTHPNRNNIIVRMHNRGRTAQQIADKLGVGKSYVVVRLREFGFSKPIDYKMPVTCGIWELPETELREAIARRAALGAKAALESQQNRNLSLLSTQCTVPAPCR